MSYSFYIKVYGCQMNDYDGKRIEDILVLNGFTKEENPLNSDIVIFYTCNIREKAVHKLESTIGMINSLKTKVIAVGGCVAQAEKENIFKRIPRINLSFGPSTYHKLPEYLDDLLSGKKKKMIDLDNYKLDKFDIATRRREVTTSAYVAIQEGCDNFCTYCVVPYTRGREYSRPVIDIINEVKYLVSNGAKEIVLGGQNVNSYRGDAPYITIGSNRKTWRIEELIKAIATIDGIKRLRYLRSHPKDFTVDLMKVHTEVPMLVPFVHIPVQSGSDRILKLMNRNHTSREYLDKLKLFRDICPEIQFSSDFIVGFPSETEEDFNDTLKLVEEAKYTLSFYFKYSIRPNTPAARMPNQIDEKIKEERLAKLIKALLRDQVYYNNKLVGKTQEILITKKGKKENQYIGKNIYMQSVIINSNENIIDQFKTTLIESADENCVFGKLLD